MNPDLDEAKKKQLAAWIDEGLKLSEIQTRLATEFGLRLTYMEVRLLVNDLKLVPKDAEPTKSAAAIGNAANAKPPAPGSGKVLAGRDQPAPNRAGVSVTVDQLTRPGAVASGSVTFSDGQNAAWYLDELGRLGLVPKQNGYRPAPADVEQFQIALEREMARMGL